jgi:hypothetical protein
MVFRYDTFMPESISPPSEDAPTPTSASTETADGQRQPVQMSRHVSLTQLEALHAIPPAETEGGQTREGCATIPGEEDRAADNSTTDADG